MDNFIDVNKYYDNEIIEKYPAIIAHEYKRLLDLIECNKIYGAFLQIKDMYEVLLKLPVLLVVAEINNKIEKSDLENKLLGQVLIKPLSMGDWLEIATKIKSDSLCKNDKVLNIILEIINVINKNQIVKWRNDNIGHGALALNDDVFHNEIKRNLDIIKEYLINFKNIYTDIELFVINNNDGYESLIGDKRARKIENVKGDEIYARYESNDYRLYPFIQIINEGIYFFDSYIYKKEKTSLLNYIIGNKINLKDEYINKLYKVYSSTELFSKLNSLMNDDIYLESELEILNQIEKTSGFEPPQYINTWIESIFINDNKKGLILLQAERGMGKSIFVNSIDQIGEYKQKSLDKYGVSIRAYYINDTYGSSIDNFEREINDIFTYDKSKNDKLKGTKIFGIESKEDVAKALNYYRKIHERYYNKNKILFIVDGIDENIKSNGHYLLDLIPDNSMLDEGVFILLTCRTNEEIISNKVLISKLDKIKFIDKKSFYRIDNDDYKNILKKYIKKKLKDLKSSDEDELDKILEYSDYRFLYLNVICQIINSNNVNVNISNINSNDFIESFFKILEEQYGEKFYNKLIDIFSIISIAYQPISINQISELLGESNPSFEIIPMLYDIKGFLVVERFKCGNVYSISNEEIKDTILNKFRTNVNKIINNYFDDILNAEFNEEYYIKCTEVFFVKNIRYYARLADINQERYINIRFIENLFKLISNVKFNLNNYDEVEIFIELCSEVIELINSLRYKFDTLNNESNNLKYFINNKVLIDLYMMRALSYTYINKQSKALEDYVISVNSLIKFKDTEEQKIKLAMCYSELGKIYRYINTNISIYNYDKAIKLYKELSKNDVKYKEDYLGNILNKANTYLRIDAEKAIYMYKMFIDEYKIDINNDNNLKNLSIAYVSKARAYRRIDNYNKAIESINIALEYYNKINIELKDEYFLAKLYVNRGSIYLKYYEKESNILEKVINDSENAINILNQMINDDKFIEVNTMINAYFNKGVVYFYNNEKEKSLNIFSKIEKMILEALSKNEYINYELIIFTYKYMIILNKENVFDYYNRIISTLNILRNMDDVSINKALEEVYYILLELLQEHEFDIIIKIAKLTESFINNTISVMSSKIKEDIVAIYTIISIACIKGEDNNKFKYYSESANTINPLLYQVIYSNFIYI